MKAKTIFLFLLCVQSVSFGQNAPVTTAQYKQDYDFFWTSIDNEYCYFNKKQTNWQQLKQLYFPAIDTITSRNGFIDILERSFYEIYDHHAILNTNTDHSQRLIPSGTDTWAEFINGKPVITELRKGFGAERCGIRAGMEVVAVNDIPVQTAIKTFLPKTFRGTDNEALSFALRVLLAGNHVQPRKFTLMDKDGLQLEHIKFEAKLESRVIEGIGYIRINDCLYDNELIPAFDSVMQQLRNTRALIIDLRETPSGGNTTVAKAILGWFTGKEQFYQKHEYYAEEKAYGIKSSWEEIVSPRKGKYYGKPLAILCDHWTGSMGEGITIGFDALKRPGTKTIGTQMARLSGAVNSFEMPNTKIRFTFPVERIYHINGQPREQYIPGIFIDMQKEKAEPKQDIILKAALQFHNKK